tara:strand:- start:666 stop:1115 length:450 start_codon:yes stop_codon:yes gene_type:complete
MPLRLPVVRVFEQAWDLLKRQTTLGEHKGFEDAAFSPHGEVDYYHGTTKPRAEKIMEQGLRPNASVLERVFASKDPSVASDYAQVRGRSRKEEPRMFGIRAGVKEQQLPEDRSTTSMRTFTEVIPREFLVPMEPSEISEELRPLWEELA